jgi:hypothetical protein
MFQDIFAYRKGCGEEVVRPREMASKVLHKI